MNSLIYSITPYRNSTLLDYFSQLVAGNNRGDAPMSVDDFIHELQFMKSDAPFPIEKLRWFMLKNVIIVSDRDDRQFDIRYTEAIHVPAFVENARNGIQSSIIEHSKKFYSNDGN